MIRSFRDWLNKQSDYMKEDSRLTEAIMTESQTLAELFHDGRTTIVLKSTAEKRKGAEGEKFILSTRIAK